MANSLGDQTWRGANEPPRDILPQYRLPCKGSNRKRKYGRPQPEGEADIFARYAKQLLPRRKARSSTGCERPQRRSLW